MKIKILGAGCKKCQALQSNVQKALEQTSISADIEKVTDYVDIAKFGVMSTPALVFEDKVVSSGKLLSVDEIVDVLST